MPDVTDQLRDWSNALARAVEPVDLERITSPMTSTDTSNVDRRWLAVAASGVVIAAGILAVATLGNDDADQIIPATTPPHTQPAPATSVVPEATSPPSTTVNVPTTPTVPLTTTVQAPEQAAIWPAADVVFETPQAAADDFMMSVLGAGVLGDFRQIDARSGEIEVRSNADAPPGTTSLRALLQLRQLRPTDGWYVTSATSQGASISLPVAGAEVPAGLLTVEGEARGFESTLNIFAFAAGPDFSALDDIDAVLASGGAFEQTEPYSATIDLSTASPGDVITILVRGDTGLSDDPGEFAAIPIVIAPAS